MFIKKCSTMGPNASGGKNVNPPTMRMIPLNSSTKSQLSVLNVPDETGVIFFFAMLPAMAITGTIIPNLPISIPKPSITL